MEFEWKIFQGFIPFGVLEQIQEFMKEQKCEPEQFKGRIIFVSMFNDIVSVRNMLADFFAVTGHSWDLDQKRSGTELILRNLLEFGTDLPRT